MGHIKYKFTCVLKNGYVCKKVFDSKNFMLFSSQQYSVLTPDMLILMF